MNPRSRAIGPEPRGSSVPRLVRLSFCALNTVGMGACTEQLLINGEAAAGRGPVERREQERKIMLMLND